MRKFRLGFAAVVGGTFLLLGQQWLMHRSEYWNVIYNSVTIHLSGREVPLLECGEIAYPGISQNAFIVINVVIIITFVVGLAMLYEGLFDNTKPSRSR